MNIGFHVEFSAVLLKLSVSSEDTLKLAVVGFGVFAIVSKRPRASEMFGTGKPVPPKQC